MKIKSTVLLILGFFVMLTRPAAQNITDSIKTVLAKAEHDTLKIKLLNLLAHETSYANTDTAIILAKQALAASEKLLKSVKKNKDLKIWLSARKGMGQAFLNLGTFSKEQSNYQEALDYFNKALLVWQDLEKQVTEKSDRDFLSNQIALSHGKTGGVYRHQGNFPQALSHYFEALEMSERLGNKKTTAAWLGNIGIAYSEQGDYKKALDYYLKALSVFQEIGNKGGIATAYANIAGSYQDDRQFKKSLQFYELALNSFKELGYKSHMGAALGNIGGVYFELREYEKALDYFLQALKADEEMGNKDGVGRHMGNIGTLYSARKNFKEAEKYLKESLVIAEGTGSLDDIKVAHDHLATMYSNSNRWQLAFEHFRQYSLMKDSLFSEEKNKEITKKEMTYEFEKKAVAEKAAQEKKDVLTQKEIQKQTMQRNGFIGGFALMLALAVVSYRNYRNKRKAHEIITAQKILVEEHQKEIMDSINYAKRIQYALLASDTLLENNLPEHFVLFKPKDIVSGDFYWAAPVKEGFVYITADCTGHGVPGAFMSLLNISKLSQTINENGVSRPDLVLNNVRREIINALNPPGSKEESKDGMDAILCKLNINEMKLEYAAANNSFYIIRNRQILNCKADKMPVGKGHDDTVSFTYNEIELQKGDMVYTLTDGYADQFGGPKGKKYKYKQLEELLLSINNDSMSEQKQKLEQAFENWKGPLEQVDDVCIIGVRL